MRKLEILEIVCWAMFIFGVIAYMVLDIMVG